MPRNETLVNSRSGLIRGSLVVDYTFELNWAGKRNGLRVCEWTFSSIVLTIPRKTPFLSTELSGGQPGFPPQNYPSVTFSGNRSLPVPSSYRSADRTWPDGGAADAGDIQGAVCQQAAGMGTLAGDGEVGNANVRQEAPFSSAAAIPTRFLTSPIWLAMRSYSIHNLIKRPSINFPCCPTGIPPGYPRGYLAAPFSAYPACSVPCGGRSIR